MDAENIVRLTPDALRKLLDSRSVQLQPKQAPGHRRAQRWPFAGAVEVWLPETCYGERYVLATLHNLSVGGLALRCRRPIPSGTRLALALHQPEQSLYGEAVVRHCTQTPGGYLVGLEFVFEERAE